MARRVNHEENIGLAGVEEAIEALRAHAAALPDGLADDDPRALALFEECEAVLGLESIEMLALYRCSGDEWILFGDVDALRGRIAERLGQR